MKHGHRRADPFDGFAGRAPDDRLAQNQAGVDEFDLLEAMVSRDPLLARPRVSIPIEEPRSSTIGIAVRSLILKPHALPAQPQRDSVGSAYIPLEIPFSKSITEMGCSR